MIADISGSGACVWTSGPLCPGTTLTFRISFAEPPAVHDVVGVVVWVEPAGEKDPRGECRSGVEWLGATRACRERLRALAGLAVEPSGSEQYPFQARWKAREPRRGV